MALYDLLRGILTATTGTCRRLLAEALASAEDHELEAAE